MNPYQVLGVRKNASTERITKAYRALAMRHHPDRGGDRTTFEAVQLAFDVLSDDARRKRFNETGQTDQERDTSLGQVMSIISPCFVAVLQEMLKHGTKPSEADIVEHMRTAIKGRTEQIRQERDRLVKLRKLFEESAGRFTVEDGPNFLESMVKTHLQGIASDTERADKALVANEKALEFLAKYRFKHVKRQRSATGSTGSASATTAGWVIIG